uniref:DUF2258 domain-containing protein n=1 Tax=Ignisphaera aggregans TaxID=334771 RepID=A0A7J3QDH0_9CREN
MPRLSSGLVIAGAYADKIRRTLFAQLRDYVRKEKEWGQRIAFAVAQINRVLYTLLVEQLKIDKGDVVRVRIDYEIDENGKNIVWKWDSLSVEAFRRIPQEQIDSMVKQLVSKATEIAMAAVAYTLTSLGETFDGDVVFTVNLGERDVGAAIITPVNESLAILKRGAVIEPTPAIFEKVKLEIPAGSNVEDVLKNTLATVIQSARHVSVDEALKIINAIRERVAAKPIPKYEEVEEEG